MILYYFRKYWWVVSAAIIALAFVIPYQVVLVMLFAQIIAVNLVSFRIRRYLKPERNVKSLRNLLVLEFKDLLESHGVSCDFPPRGDYSSVDLIADIFGEKTVFSIREGNDEIHNSEVQSLAASLPKHGAKHGVILVDGLLPIEAKRLAESYGLQFKRYQKYKEEVQERLSSNPNVCSVCGRVIDQNQKELQEEFRASGWKVILPRTLQEDHRQVESRNRLGDDALQFKKGEVYKRSLIHEEYSDKRLDYSYLGTSFLCAEIG